MSTVDSSEYGYFLNAPHTPGHGHPFGNPCWRTESEPDIAISKVGIKKCASCRSWTSAILCFRRFQVSGDCDWRIHIDCHKDFTYRASSTASVNQRLHQMIRDWQSICHDQARSELCRLNCETPASIGRSVISNWILVENLF
jgi:hypothetical protein